MWRRVASLLALVFAVASTSAARAHDRTEPPPPPGTYRLIRIGPEALVSEDSHGNIRMVDERTKRISKGQAIGSAFGALGGGVAGLLFYDGQDAAAGTAYGADLPFDESAAPSSATEHRRLPAPEPARSPP
jgi:hypothetical protein